jgi:hypothetical protein
MEVSNFSTPNYFFFFLLFGLHRRLKIINKDDSDFFSTKKLLMQRCQMDVCPEKDRSKNEKKKMKLRLFKD